MNRPRFRRASPATERSIADRLKEHPMWMFGSGAAAMAAFVVTVFLPMTTAYLNAQIETMRPAHEKLKEAESQIAQLKKDVSTAKAERDEAAIGNPFAPTVVYPNGLGTLILGSPIAKVVERYPGSVRVVSDAFPETGYVTVKTGHAVFPRVAYYFTVGADERVEGILYHPKDGEGSQAFLRNRLTQLFGPPAAELQDGRAYWKANPREIVEIAENGGVYIEAAGRVPRWAKTRAKEGADK